MALMNSTRGATSKLNFSSTSLSYDGRGRVVVASQAPVAWSALPSGSGNDKELMQNLNYRLANYLEKVCALEESNKHLDNQIRQKLLEQNDVPSDYSIQFSEINGFMKKIADAISENTKLLLKIDNTRLAADEFQVKWNNESILRQLLEKDLIGWRKTKEHHESVIFSVRKQLESLPKELLTLKKEHKKELATIKETLAISKLNVEVDAVQGPDLNTVLSEIRSQYEGIIRKNKEEADALFHSQYESMTMKMQKEDQDCEKAKHELRYKQNFVQSAQLELDSIKKQVNVLKQNLDETRFGCRNELDMLQCNITQVEQDLSEILKIVQHNKLEYEALLKIKETLEAEIKEYRRLLDGNYEESVKSEPKQPDIRTKKIIKTVTQTLIDGKIVDESSEVEEFVKAEKALQ